MAPPLKIYFSFFAILRTAQLAAYFMNKFVLYFSFLTFFAQRGADLGHNIHVDSSSFDGKVATKLRHVARERRDNYRFSEIESLVLQNDELRSRHLGQREMSSYITGSARDTIRQRVVEENRSTSRT